MLAIVAMAATEPTSYVAPALYTYGYEGEVDPPLKKFVEAQEIQLTDNGDGTYAVVIMGVKDVEGDPAGDIKFNAAALPTTTTT